MNKNVLIGTFLSVYSAFAGAQTQEIFIKGVLTERRDVNRAGQSIVVSPSEETRFDTQIHFKADPSINLSGGGQSGGFSLPLFRGQDARSSHVFIDDMELQDPYSGLPMIDDLDLRAFGTMIIHKGVSPWNIPVIEPGGVVQFSLKNPGTVIQGGALLGDVLGASSWLKTSTPIESVVDAGAYARRSTRRGDYRFYSDNNTVLNPSDDKVVRRDNNDRASSQILGHIGWNNSQFNSRMIAWSQSSEQGVPSGQATSDGAARLRADTQVVTSGLRTYLTESYWLGLDVGAFNGVREFNDPFNDIGFASKRRLKSQSARIRGAVGGESNILNWLISAERQEAKSKLSSTYSADVFSPHVSANKIFVGAKLKLFEFSSLELKVGTQWSEASTQSTNVDDNRSENTSRSVGGSIGWSRFVDDWLQYVQLAKSTRGPSLLERLGNGAEIDGAGDLSGEETRMIEIGSRNIFALDKNSRALINVALWARDNDQVIRIERISATRWRARNGGAQMFRGIELRSDVGTDNYGLEAAASWLRADQVKSRRIVPYTPMWQATGGLRWQFAQGVIARTMSRYIGRMYQDVSNTREVDWTMSHDASLDYTSESSRLKVGIAVNNLTNVQSTTIRDTVTDQADGRIAWTQFNGEPLPGRSWLISTSVRL